MNKATISQKKEIKTTRLIGEVTGETDGPTLIFFGGIHGNEPSGVIALEKVFQEISRLGLSCKGSAYGIRGNIPALLKKKRFLEADLNRIWLKSQIEPIFNKSQQECSAEELELIEIHKVISKILNTSSPPYYFVDYHTTSSPTLPFITINDALINRNFSRLFPVPVILGIEEYLDGPLLSYINELGYVSLGFESGQHATHEAALCSIAFTWLTMIYSGFLEDNQMEAKSHRDLLNELAKGNNSFYEVIYRQAISGIDQFSMYPGFKSFDTLKKGTPLAVQNKEEIKAEKDTIIFMPLYQDQGEEGFFLIKEIPSWILRFSAFLRNIRMDTLLTYLPGVSWSKPSKEQLKVNLKIARFFSKPFFHLLGYRNKVVDSTHLILSNREKVAKKDMYKNTFWFK